MSTCPACQHANPDSAKFCNECGTRLTESGQPGVGVASAGDTLVGGDVVGRDKFSSESHTTLSLSGGTVALPGGVAASDGAVAVGGDVYGDIVQGGERRPEPPRGLRDAYLSSLVEQVRAVPLAGVDPKSIREETRHDLELAAVYTALLTRRAEPGAELPARPERSDSRPLSALEVLNKEKSLALLGDPGSGKSTFVNFVALCLAGQALGLKDANLATLTQPPPPDEDRPTRTAEALPPQPWDHGALLPVRVILREFVARGLPPLDKPAPVGGDTLWRFMTAELPETLKDFADPLRAELLGQGGLLLLDGLDEVPEASQRREQVKAAVEKFAAAFPKVRVLVTSRTYAYQNQAWKLAGFAEVVLAPFSPTQIDGFVKRWYAFVGQARRLTPDDIQGRAAALRAAIQRSASLRELAQRPLLLTLMASLHAWRGGALPEDREALFADAVDLLLDQWESQKLRRGPDGRPEVAEPGLAEWLRVDHKTVRSALNRLAFGVHRHQPTLTGTADIAEKDLLDALLALNPDCRPGPLVKFIGTRTGLLEPRGVGVYAFPHRTFQEYLAACHLTERDDFPENIADLARAEPNRWREVALLAGVKAARGAAANAWALAESLCPDEPPAQKAEGEAGYWGALLATQSLLETRSLEKVAERNRPKVARLQGWLVQTLEQGALPPVDRAEAGDALAALGDPRFRAEAWFLPAEPLLGFVEVPAGSFTMGSDPDHDSDAQDHEQPQHTVALPAYFIGRYPVTVAQFGAFVQASGYGTARQLWREDPGNRPVRSVTWHDALAYCEWLTKTLKNWDRTPPELARLLQREDWRVRLPSEAEWEKAARGPSPGSGGARVYPWGNDFEASLANTAEAGLGTTSAVGMFPGGLSPYEVLDLSGNVFEWTRSLWGKDWQEPEFKYPYDPEDERRENLKAPDGIPRVLRGGSFYLDRGVARCAFRLRYGPDLRYDFIGFRCVVSPFRRGGAPRP